MNEPRFRSGEVPAGQPSLEVFDDAKALMAKLDTLNCKPIAADLDKASTDAEKLACYQKVAQEKTLAAVAIAATQGNSRTYVNLLL